MSFILYILLAAYLIAGYLLNCAIDKGWPEGVERSSWSYFVMQVFWLPSFLLFLIGIQFEVIVVNDAPEDTDNDQI